MPRPIESLAPTPRPVRDNYSTEDSRVLALLATNAEDPAWVHVPDEESEPDTSDIPPGWRAKGYESVARLMSAWTGKTVDSGTIRSWWRFDLGGARSVLLPPPDAIIKRRGGTLLPGWTDYTIRTWMYDRVGSPTNMDTYLAWDAVTDEVDPAIIALIEGNRARKIGFNPSITWPDMPPNALISLGYDFTAQVISRSQGKVVSDNTLCKYWREDLFRPYEPDPDNYVDAYSLRMPVPDAIIARGTRSELLPGWSRSTIEAWVPTRPGSGNHTRGENRVGYKGGHTGMRFDRATGKWISNRMTGASV